MITGKKCAKVLGIAAAMLIVMSCLAILAGDSAYAGIQPDPNNAEKLTFTSSGNSYTAWERTLYYEKSEALNYFADIDTAKSSNESIFKVYFDSDGFVVIYPTGTGTATLTVTDTNGDSVTETVKVESGYFQDVLDNSNWVGPGEYVSYSDEDWGEDFVTSDSANACYGDTMFLICLPYKAGARATLTVGGEDIGPDEANPWEKDQDFRVFYHDFLVKLKTDITFHIEWAGASRDYYGKVISNSKIKPKKIKKNSKSGTAALYEVHKGDYLKIKVGKKYVKTVKFKKYLWKKTVKWSNKKKMKKGTKVTYILYNKYKQKLAKAVKKVG